MTRRELREHIFRLLFRRDFYSEEEMKEQETFYLEALEAPSEKDAAYIREKTERILEKVPELDAAIDAHATGWSVKRMAKAELTIMRLAVYEMKYDDDVPVSVAINEAVELAKRYGGDHAPSFVNGVLAKLS